MNEKVTATQIDCISTTDLIEVLINRFDHAVFSGLRVDDKKGDQLECEYQGDEFVCMGLATGLGHKVYSENNIMPDEDDDDED